MEGHPRLDGLQPADGGEGVATFIHAEMAGLVLETESEAAPRETLETETKDQARAAIGLMRVTSGIPIGIKAPRMHASTRVEIAGGTERKETKGVSTRGPT